MVVGRGIHACLKEKNGGVTVSTGSIRPRGMPGCKHP